MLGAGPGAEGVGGSLLYPELLEKGTSGMSACFSHRRPVVWSWGSETSAQVLLESAVHTAGTCLQTRRA